LLDRRAVSEQKDTTADVGDPEERAARDLVPDPEQADRRRGEHDGGRYGAIGREVMACTNRGSDREHADKGERAYE
jgi:hypothetical protein